MRITVSIAELTRRDVVGFFITAPGPVFQAAGTAQRLPPPLDALHQAMADVEQCT